MTDDEWLTCTDPKPMLEFLRGKASDRKLRLFACGCCRRIWHMLTDQRSRMAVEVAEQRAEGKATAKEMDRVLSPALLYAHHQHQGGPKRDAAYAAAWSSVLFPADCVTSAQFAAGVVALDANSGDCDEGCRAERSIQVILVRCIFANPFRPIAIDPVWLTPTVLGLAQATYDERILPVGSLNPTRLAVLADALEEAGCTDADILNHCRQPGEHVRGCWTLDMILGKG